MASDQPHQMRTRSPYWGLTVVDQFESQWSIAPDRHFVGAVVSPLHFELGFDLPCQVKDGRREVTEQFELRAQDARNTNHLAASVIYRAAPNDDWMLSALFLAPLRRFR